VVEVTAQERVEHVAPVALLEEVQEPGALVVADLAQRVVGVDLGARADRQRLARLRHRADVALERVAREHPFHLAEFAAV
jgi:hypothetical protein